MHVSSGSMNMTFLWISLLASASAADEGNRSAGHSVQAVASARIVAGETVRMNADGFQANSEKYRGVKSARLPLARSTREQTSETGASLNLTEFY